MRTASLQHCDAFEWLDDQGDASIDAVITDPPYNTMNAAWDAGSLDLDRWWQVVRRKLKPAGVVVSFAAGRFVYRLHASNPAWFRYELVWSKTTQPIGFLNARRAPLRAHELILVFAPRFVGSTYNPQKVASPVPLVKLARAYQTSSTLYGAHSRRVAWRDDGTRYPSSVLPFAAVRRSDRIHPTEKPIDLVRWLVRTYTNPGDVVADTFSGGGTTAAACLIEGRQFVGCERDRAFYRGASKRLERLAAAA